MHDVFWTPRAGIRQGDPFSAALFVLLASVVIPILQKVHPNLHVFMYADNLVIYIACLPEDAELLQEGVEALNTFGLHTGLPMNASKSKVLLKALHLQQFVGSLGLKLADKIRYLGVIIGEVSEKDIYSLAVSRSFLRAQIGRDLDLTRAEKVELLKAWIYPLWILRVRVCYCSKPIIRQMNVVVQTALGIDSWGLTLTELGQPYGEGGFDLVLPNNFLPFHHSSLFLHFMSKPHHFAPQCVRTFESWAGLVGLSLDLAHLPTLQLGLVPWESLNTIGLSCKAWSQLRRLLPRSVNEHLTVGDIPLHHNALFVWTWVLILFQPPGPGRSGVVF